VTEPRVAEFAEGVEVETRVGARLVTGVGARLRSWRVGWALLVGYLLLSMLLWHSMLGGVGSRAPEGGQGDPGLFMWWLGWAAHAVTHGLDPLRTTYLQAPNGVSAVWNTSVLALGVPMTPVTLLFGTAASFNVLLILSPALSCWSASKWLRRHVGTLPAACAALLYGFSPFMLTHLGSHLHLTFLVLPPLILLLVEDLLVGARPLWPTAPLLGVTVAVQYFIGSEVLLMLALTLMPVAALLAARRAQFVRARTARLLAAGLMSLGVAAVLLAYGLHDQFPSDYRMDTPIFQASAYVSALGNLVRPIPRLFFSGGAPRGGLSSAENGSYIGWPLILTLLIIMVMLRKNLMVVVAGLVAVVAVICELDPRVAVSGSDRIALSPLTWVQHFVPLTANILPARFASVFFLAAALILAYGLATAISLLTTNRWQGWAGITMIAVALASLLPGPPARLRPVPAVPAFFTDGTMQRVIPAGSTVMVAPMATIANSDAEYWQSNTGMWFRQLGGYMLNNRGDGHPSLAPRQDALVNLFAGDATHIGTEPVSGSLLIRARRELDDSGATFFLMGPSSKTAVVQRQIAVQLLGRSPDFADAGVSVWRLPRHCTAVTAGVGRLCPP